MTQDSEPKKTPRRRRSHHLGLSGKLLVLTILFVMVAVVLIYVPAIATYRVNWLNDRLAAAHTGALVLEAAPSRMVPESLRRQILDSVGARSVVLKTGERKSLLAVSESPDMVHQSIDLRNVSSFGAIVGALETMFVRKDSDLIRAVGPAPMGGDFVEIVLEEGPMRQAMLNFSVYVMLISLLISGITGMLVFFALHFLFVRPMRRITTNMIAFRKMPENPALVIAVTRRQDEIGLAESELNTMQRDLASMLQQKSRLAALGLAVSKINHDLRNLLASARLFSEGLSSLPDPRVQRFAPKLMHALERAIAFAESTLSYGRVQERPPERKPVQLEALVQEVRETLGLISDAQISWIMAIERGMIVDADYDQLFRVLLNLSRNAMQALASRTPNDPARDQIRVTGRREGAVVVIELSDTGPGFSQKAKEHLFEAFQGSTRSGGTGLGLAIASELVRAHGGEIRLIEGTIGATFHITIPDRAIELSARRGKRRA
ncbi:MAG TPA: HAMP domain-containing sensor histidine kinase [Xanthobacteraceae bacterium]|nr:HAMP domain-containing sensor histidine kinase [Xanthobacteraceae bacterium]